MLDAAVLDAMVDAGCTAEQIVAAVKADMAKDEARREAKRAGNAERQQRFRDKRKKRKSRRGNGNNALRGVIPPIDNNHTPRDISSDDESLTPASDAETILNDWRVVAKPLALPCWDKLTPKRRKAVNARIADHGLEAIQRAIEHIPKSSFLRGEKGDWNGANLDFLMRPDTVPKILEGQYDDRQRSAANDHRTPNSGRNTAELAMQKLGHRQ